MRLPIQIQINIYRRNNSEIQFLLLKRTKERGGFWQPITGGYESTDANKSEAAYRETYEETKVKENQILNIYENIHYFEFNIKDFDKKGKTELVKEYVYGFEISQNTQITIDSHEHSEFKWLPYKKAEKIVKHDDYKIAMKNILKKISEK